MTPAGFQYSPHAQGDDLATLLVRRLEHHRWTRSWGLIKTLVLGIPSFGLIPLLAWSASFREYATEESQVMQELAQWAKLRGRQPAAVGPLVAAAEGTSPSPLPFILALLLSALVVGVFVIQFAHVEFSIDELVNLTYARASSRWLDSPPGRGDFVHRVWVISLGLGYCVQWLHVRAHAADTRRFIERLNPIIQVEGLQPLRIPTRGWVVFRPLWILTAVVLGTYGAWWGIPMVLAGMAQKRYTNLTGRVVRHELAKRVRDVATLRQAPLAFTFPVAGRCLNPRCLAAIRPHSRFCSRCGAATNRETSA